MISTIIRDLEVEHKRSEDSYRVKRRTVGDSLYKEIVQTYPPLRGNPTYRRLFRYIVLQHHPDREAIPVPHKLLADIAKIHPRKLKGERLLEDFKRDVLPGMTYSGYSADNHKCRVILETGIDDFLQRRLDQDNEVKRRDMESGKVYNRSRQKEVHAIRLEANNTLVEATLCDNEAMREVHRAMLNDLNNLPLPLFQGLADGHYNEAWSVASELSYENESKRRKLQLELQAVRDMPKPFYHPVGQHARFYSSGGLPTIEKEVRRAFFPKEEGYVELDIACCQFAIGAGLWQLESIQEILQAGVLSGQRYLIIWRYQRS